MERGSWFPRSCPASEDPALEGGEVALKKGASILGSPLGLVRGIGWQVVVVVRVEVGDAKPRRERSPERGLPDARSSNDVDSMRLHAAFRSISSRAPTVAVLGPRRRDRRDQREPSIFNGSAPTADASSEARSVPAARKAVPSASEISWGSRPDVSDLEGPRAGVRFGASVGSPMPRRYRATLVGSVTSASSFILPLQHGQVSTSKPDVLLSSSAHGR